MDLADRASQSVGRLWNRDQMERRVSLLPFLLGALLGIIARAFIAPPWPVRPIDGDLVWLSIFGVLGGLVGAILGFAMRGAGPPSKT